jgi:hypothetical protein
METVAFRLLIDTAEDRVVRRGRIAAVLALTLFTVVLGAGCGYGDAARHPEPHGSRIVAAPAVRAEDAVVDVYGNEVTEAVATYKLDSSGAIYEEHSPQTEVPRLGSPKT